PLLRPATTAALALALAAAALAGCSGGDPLTTGSLPTDGYRTQYPIVLAEGEETLDVPVGFGSAGLSASARDNVRAFAASAAERGTSSLVILAPSGSGNEAAAAAVVREAHREALRGGLSKNLIEVRRYAVGDSSAAAPVRLSYSRVKAVSPSCGHWTEQMIPGSGNGDATEFGCSTQANFAAMISNPEDLITPRVETAIPANRRILVLGKWVEGAPTSTVESLQGSETTGEN
ncbi:MAG TPA: CpaD family pilus assembly protein, partial [Methylomirabilota bacterium]|nr:CpaD family pilus assembly protein [Methylomirabilota bacterium]